MVSMKRRNLYVEFCTPDKMPYSMEGRKIFEVRNMDMDTCKILIRRPPGLFWCSYLTENIWRTKTTLKFESAISSYLRPPSSSFCDRAQASNKMQVLK